MAGCVAGLWFPFPCHATPCQPWHALCQVKPKHPCTLACDMQAMHRCPRAAAMRSAMAATSLATGLVRAVSADWRRAVVAMPSHLTMCKLAGTAGRAVPCLAMPSHLHNCSVHVIVQHAMWCHTVPWHALYLPLTHHTIICRPAGRWARHLPGPGGQQRGRALGAAAQGGVLFLQGSSPGCVRFACALHAERNRQGQRSACHAAACPAARECTAGTQTVACVTLLSSCRVRAARRTAAWPTAAPCCAAAFGSTLPARQCMPWGCPRRAR